MQYYKHYPCQCNKFVHRPIQPELSVLFYSRRFILYCRQLSVMVKSWKKSNFCFRMRNNTVAWFIISIFKNELFFTYHNLLKNVWSPWFSNAGKFFYPKSNNIMGLVSVYNDDIYVEPDRTDPSPCFHVLILSDNNYLAQ